MKIRRSVIVLAMLLALAALVVGVAACGSSTSSSSSTAAASTTPVKGGTFTVTFQGEPTGLDPAIAWEVESNCIEKLTYQTAAQLREHDRRGRDQARGRAGHRGAQRRQRRHHATAASVYTFHIKQGVKFAPPVSRDVTAEDFKYSIERMLKSPLAPATYFYTGITGAQAFIDGKAKDVTGLKVLDPYTLQVTLDKPDVSFVYTFTLTFTSAIPKEWVAKWGKRVDRHPLGSGPYIIQSWTPGQEIVAVKNPNWTGRPPVRQRVPLRVLVEPGHRAAQARAWRSRPARRHDPAGRLPAYQGRPDVGQVRRRRRRRSTPTTCTST